MKIYEYASDKYGRIPNYIETGASLYPDMVIDGSNVSGGSGTTVNPPATQEVSDFVFVFVLCIIVFLMLWK